MLIPSERSAPDVVIAREPGGARVMAWYVAPHIAHLGRWGEKESVPSAWGVRVVHYMPW